MFDEDYISCLLTWLQETPHADEPEYLAQQRREDQATDALRETFSAAQQKLFLRYEEQFNNTTSMFCDELARQAFLLAREIFRS